MIAITTIVFVLILYWKIKNQYIMRLTKKYQYRLYDLRDHLRELAISEKIEKTSWEFKYLDGSLSKTVHELQYINIFTGYFLIKRYKKDRNFSVHKKFISSSMEKNIYTQFVYEEYGDIIFGYMINKHFLITGSLLCVALGIRAAGRLNELIKRAAGNFRIIPETSKAYDYDEASVAFNYNHVKTFQ